MGSEQSKGKKKNEEAEHHKVANNLSEGTSVDAETKSFIPEEPTPQNNEGEVYTEEEPAENKLTGLPGETIPVSIASPHIDNQENVETHNEHELMNGNTMLGLHHEKSITQEVKEVSSKCIGNKRNYYKKTNLIENVNSESLEVNTSVEFDEGNAYHEDTWDVGPVVNEYYTESDSCKNVKEKENETVDCILTTKESSASVKFLKDLKVARKNYELPLQLGLEGKFKKKATLENDDNRNQCCIDDDKFTHESIFTNVIFLPDKSKGASPKRYGPKRLGSIYDDILEEDNDNYTEFTADDKTLQNVPKSGQIENVTDRTVFETIAERDIQTDTVETSIAIEGRTFGDSFRDRSKVEKSELTTIDRKVEEVTTDEKNTTSLYFVEDHFSLYSGSIAEGLSKEFKDERALKPNGSGHSHSVLSHVEEENNNNETKTVERRNSIQLSHDLRQQHNFEGTEDVGNVKFMGSGDNTNSQELNLPTSKFALEQEQKRHKGKESNSASCNDTFQEQEIVEICRNCREPLDFCLCLFPGIKTVMPVLFDYKQKPSLAYLRYLRINDKEINWSVLKSAQAIFIKGMKSHNTEISEDNRVAFRFELPASKGFFGPPEKHESVVEECEHESEVEYNTGLDIMSEIENKIGFDISGFQLNGSMGSYRNIIVNNFDACSETDEEISEADNINDSDDEFQSKDDNACKDIESIFTVDIDTSEKSCSAKNNDMTEGDVARYFSGSTGDRNFSGSNTRMQSSAHENIDGRVDCLHRSSDSIHEAEQLQESKSCTCFNSNLHDLYECRSKEEYETAFSNKDNLPYCIRDFSSISNIENIVQNGAGIKCDITTGECKLKTEEEVVKACEKRTDKCAIICKNSDRNCDNVKVGTLFVREDNSAHGILQSNEGNECMPSVSSPVVSITGIKSSFDTSPGISSSLSKESGKVQKVDGNLLMTQNKQGFLLESFIKKVDVESREQFLIDSENLYEATTSSQISVDTCTQELPETNASLTSGEMTVCSLPDQVNVEALEKKDQFDHFDSEIVNVSKHLLDKKDMKTLEVHFGSNLRRKLTAIEEDNRFVESCSDDDETNEGKFVTYLHKEEQTGKEGNVLDRDDEEDEDILVPAHYGSGRIPVKKIYDDGMSGLPVRKMSSFRPSGHISGSSIKIQLPMLGDLTSDIDFTLPPDQFLKQLQERTQGLIGMHRPNVTKNPFNPSARRHRERHPRRPDPAISDFAHSFYGSYDRNSQPSAEPFQNHDYDSDSGSRLVGNLERFRAERSILESNLRSRTTSSSSASSSFQSSRSDTPVPSCDGSNDEECPDVKLNELWNPVLLEEKNNCLQGARIPASYRCTVLCVDVSESMKGLPWQHVTQFVPEFLSGLEDKKQSENIEEFVAMVTFGYKTKIVTQPAKNYTQLQKDFRSLRPEGNSPLLPGIALSLLIQTVRKEFGQRYCKLHNIIVRHRIILLSDGWPSPTSLVCMSDDFPDLIQKEACQEVESSLQEWKLPSQYTHVDCVPAGPDPNLAMLETICRITNGRLVKPSEVQYLVNSTHNHYIAAQVSKHMLQEKAGPFDEHIFKSLVLSLYPDTSHTDLAEMKELLDTAQAHLLAQQLEGTDTMNLASEEDFNFEPKDLQDLPQIGTRVVLGPDVSSKLLQFKVETGTITGHSRKHRGKVFVHWDNGANTLCNCGYKEKFEVFPADVKDQCNIDDHIKVGHKVRRGPDWKYGNQDGGGDQLGTVIKIHQNGNVLVKWPNGNQNKYRYNQCGMFDLLISDPEDTFGTKLFESEMNKRNQARSETAELLQDGNSVTSHSSEDMNVTPKSGDNSLGPKSNGDNSVQPKSLGDNSVRPKSLGDNSV